MQPQKIKFMKCHQSSDQLHKSDFQRYRTYPIFQMMLKAAGTTTTDSPAARTQRNSTKLSSEITLNSKLPKAEKKLWQAWGTAHCLIYSLNHKINFSQLRLDWRIRNQVLKSELTQLESEVNSNRTLDEEKCLNRQSFL